MYDDDMDGRWLETYNQIQEKDKETKIFNKKSTNMVFNFYKNKAYFQVKENFKVSIKNKRKIIKNLKKV